MRYKDIEIGMRVRYKGDKHLAPCAGVVLAEPERISHARDQRQVRVRWEATNYVAEHETTARVASIEPCPKDYTQQAALDERDRRWAFNDWMRTLDRALVAVEDHAKREDEARRLSLTRADVHEAVTVKAHLIDLMNRYVAQEQAYIAKRLKLQHELEEAVQQAVDSVVDTYGEDEVEAFMGHCERQRHMVRRLAKARDLSSYL